MTKSNFHLTITDSKASNSEHDVSCKGSRYIMKPSKVCPHVMSHEAPPPPDVPTLHFIQNKEMMHDARQRLLHNM